MIFFHKIKSCCILRNKVLKVNYFESRLFALEILLRKRLSKGNFEIKIFSVKEPKSGREVPLDYNQN